MKNLQTFLKKALYPRMDITRVFPGATVTKADEKGKMYVDFLPIPTQVQRGFKEFHGFIDVKKPGIISINKGEETEEISVIELYSSFLHTDFLHTVILLAHLHGLDISRDDHQIARIDIELEDYSTLADFKEYLCKLCSYMEEIDQYAVDNYLDLEEYGAIADKAQEINKFLQAVLMSVKNPN